MVMKSHSASRVEAMKPSLLKRHLNGCHPDLVDKNITYFKQREKGIKKIRLDQKGHLSKHNEAGLRASFLVVVSTFFHNEGISWDDVCVCTTDGAPAMLGYRSGFRTRVRAVTSNAKHLHCVIHRHALSSKTLPPELKDVLDDVVSMVNAIKSSALNTRLFLFKKFSYEGGTRNIPILVQGYVGR